MTTLGGGPASGGQQLLTGSMSTSPTPLSTLGKNPSLNGGQWGKGGVCGLGGSGWLAASYLPSSCWAAGERGALGRNPDPHTHSTRRIALGLKPVTLPPPPIAETITIRTPVNVTPSICRPPPPPLSLSPSGGFGVQMGCRRGVQILAHRLTLNKKVGWGIGHRPPVGSTGRAPCSPSVVKSSRGC